MIYTDVGALNVGTYDILLEWLNVNDIKAEFKVYDDISGVIDILVMKMQL